MPIRNSVAADHDELAAWRQDIHAHPELAFEETRTADVVATKLEGFGIEIDRGLGRTGVVGTLKVGESSRRIGLRADMDALPLHEANDIAYRSRNDGKMHACGHDGHTTMLLGAAKYLAETRQFDGTVHFIFQPAEELAGGAKVMIDDGLFAKFPVDAVYGMHNFPDLTPGEFGVCTGPIMASVDTFCILVKGKGTHGAMPHLGIDPVVVGAQIVTALQTIASRTLDPIDSLVVSVTQFHGGEIDNIIPQEVELRGGVRAFNPALRELAERRMREISEGIAAAHGATVDFSYTRVYPPTVNTEAETAIAAHAAREVAGADKVDPNMTPCMGSEDFAFMLEEKPGCYIMIGNGGAEGGCLLHNPHYDFNDDILPLGASYWAQLVENVLAQKSA